MSPDYTIYPENDTYFGFSTRGCIRACHFCIVSKKEGKFRRIYDTPKEALDHICGTAKFKKIQLLDNNILSDKDWFIEMCAELKKRKLMVDFNQGLDARLFDNDMAQALKSLGKPLTVWKFAFDNINYIDDVMQSIQILKNNDFNVRSSVMYYVYCHEDSSVPDAVHRCRLLKEQGVTAYSMLNRDIEQTPAMRKLSRWTRPMYFWRMDFNDFKNSVYEDKYGLIKI